MSFSLRYLSRYCKPILMSRCHAWILQGQYSHDICFFNLHDWWLSLFVMWTWLSSHIEWLIWIRWNWQWQCSNPLGVPKNLCVSQRSGDFHYKLSIVISNTRTLGCYLKIQIFHATLLAGIEWGLSPLVCRLQLTLTTGWRFWVNSRD